MQVIKNSLLEYIAGSNKRFVIPPYQRNYDWEAKNWERLCTDLQKMCEDKDKRHFFGSIVSYKTQRPEIIDYQIIDGQQRLISVSLIILSIYNLLKNQEIIFGDKTFAEQIYKKYLTNDTQDDNIKYRLKPFRGDMDAYRSIFKDDNSFEDKNIVQAYNYIKNRIKVMCQEKSINDLFDALYRFEIVDIVLEENIDDPQSIFETINSTGLPLTESDKIRNYILMGILPEKQEECYDKYWCTIEENSNQNIDKFIANYIEAKTGKSISSNNAYKEFKDFLEPQKVGKNIYDVVTDTFSDLAKYSYYYNIILGKTQHTDNDINNALYRLRILRADNTTSFLLNILDKYNNNLISKSDVLEIVNTTEIYVYRCKICYGKTNSKTFTLCSTTVDGYDGTTFNYAEKYKAYLLNETGTRKIPGDITFKEELKLKNIGDIRDLVMYTLCKFENQNDDAMSLYKDILNKTYTLEHIMPQQLTKDWELEIAKGGHNAEDIHKTWLNRLANLTLSNYNSQYSNKMFKNKKTMNNGYQSSSLRLNSYLSHFDKWTIRELNERSEHLSNIALNIWPMIKTTYSIPRDEILRVDVGSNVDFSNKNLSSYEWNGKKTYCNNWSNMYIDAVRKLYEINKDILIDIIDGEEKGFKGKFSYTNQTGRWTKIDEQVYINTNFNNDTKINIIRALFDRYGLPYNKLTFNLNPTIATTVATVKAGCTVKDEIGRTGKVILIDTDDNKMYIMFDNGIEPEKYNYPQVFDDGIIELIR